MKPEEHFEGSQNEARRASIICVYQVQRQKDQKIRRIYYNSGERSTTIRNESKVACVLVDRSPRSYICQPIKPSMELQCFHPVQYVLEYLEELFQFYHQLPISFHQIVPEVFLTGVYALPAYL